MQVVKQYKIGMKNGSLLTVDVSQEFIEKLVKHFSLADASELTPDLIEMFVYGASKSAMEKLDK